MSDKRFTLYINYNPFDKGDNEIHQIDFDEPVTVAEYLEEIKTDSIVVLNSEELDEESQKTAIIEDGDILKVAFLPSGGSDNNKQTLRIAAMIALAAVTMNMATPMLAMVAQAGGTLLINEIFPYPEPDLEPEKNAIEDSKAYGIDGAKNTANEGVAVPLVFGPYRQAGNFVNLYTENHGTKQRVFALINAGEGEIAGVEDIRVNKEPLESFDNFEAGYVTGTQDQEVIPRFSDVTVQQTVQKEFTTENESLVYAVEDQAKGTSLRVDLTFPQLFEYDDLRQIRKTTLRLKCEFRKVGETEWKSFETGYVEDGELGNTFKSYEEEYTYVIDGQNFKGTRPYDLSQFDLSNTTIEEVTAGDLNPSLHDTSPANVDPGEVRIDPDTVMYEIVTAPRISDGELVTIGERKVLNTFKYDSPYWSSGSTYVLSAESKTGYRISIASRNLEYALYEVRVTRLTKAAEEEDDVQLQYNDFNWTDVTVRAPAEITYRNSAMVYIKADVDERIASGLNITYINKGILIDVYKDGVWTQESTKNPAWVAYNIYTNTRWGASKDPSEIDLDAYIEWAEFCEEKALEFNGILDSQMSSSEALDLVFKVGRAVQVRNGALASVSILKDKPPVMMFNNSNIIKDTLSVSWNSSDERANQVDVTFFDRETDFSRETFRKYDEEVLAVGQKPQPTSMTLFGVTNRDQAIRESVFNLNFNKLSQSVSFSAPIEAIGCTVGDIILVQHDLTLWGQGGRVTETSALVNEVFIDREIDLEADKDYNIVVKHDFVDMGTFTYNSGLSDDKMIVVDEVIPHRADIVEISGVQYKVKQLDDYSFRFMGDSTTPTGTFKIFTTDFSEEAEISSFNPVDGKVSLSTNLTIPATKESLWIVGLRGVSSKPFMVQGITGSGLEVRTISAIEYDESILSDEVIGEVPSYKSGSVDLVPNVESLTYDVLYEPISNKKTARINWSYGADADYYRANVYIHKDGSWLEQGEEDNTIDIPIEYTGDTFDVVVQAKSEDGRVVPLYLSPRIVVSEQGASAVSIDSFSAARLNTNDLVIKLNWSDAKYLNGKSALCTYKIYRWEGDYTISSGSVVAPVRPDFSFFVEINETTATEYLDDTTIPGKYYYYAVQAVSKTTSVTSVELYDGADSFLGEQPDQPHLFSQAAKELIWQQNKLDEVDRFILVATNTTESESYTFDIQPNSTDPWQRYSMTSLKKGLYNFKLSTVSVNTLISDETELNGVTVSEYFDPVPSVPVNVEVTPAFGKAHLSWDFVNDDWFYSANIYRQTIALNGEADTPVNFNTAVKVASVTDKNSYTDVAPSGSKMAYWVRFENRDGEEGQVHDVNGTVVFVLRSASEFLLTYTQEIAQGVASDFLSSEFASMDLMHRLEGAASETSNGTSLAERFEDIEKVDELIAEQNLLNALNKYESNQTIKRQFSSNYASLSGGVHAAVNADLAYVTRIETLESRWENDLDTIVDSKISTEITSFTANDGALNAILNARENSFRDSLVGADDNSGVVGTIAQNRVDILETDIADPLSAVSSEIKNRASEYIIENMLDGNAIQQVYSKSQVDSIEQTLSDAVSSEAQRIDTLSAYFNDTDSGLVNARIDSAIVAFAGQDKALATILNERETTFQDSLVGADDNSGIVGTIASNRVSALETDIADPQSAVSGEIKKRASEYVSNTMFADGTVEQVQTLAEFESFVGTATDLDSAITQKIDTLTVDYNGQPATLQELSQITYDNQEGYEAQWSIKTRVGDLQGGIGFFNDGQTTTTVVDSQNFVVTGGAANDYITGTSASPFAIVDGEVVINSAFIDYAEIYTLIADNIVVDRLAANIQIDTPVLNGGAIYGSEIQVGGSPIYSGSDIIGMSNANFTVSNTGAVVAKDIIILDDDNNVVFASGTGLVALNDYTETSGLGGLAFRDNVSSSDVTDLDLSLLATKTELSSYAKSSSLSSYVTTASVGTFAYKDALAASEITGLNFSFIDNILSNNIISANIYASNIDGDVVDMDVKEFSRSSILYSSSSSYEKEIMNFDIKNNPDFDRILSIGGLFVECTYISGSAGFVNAQVEVRLYVDNVLQHTNKIWLPEDGVGVTSDMACTIPKSSSGNRTVRLELARPVGATVSAGGDSTGNKVTVFLAKKGSSFV